MNIRDAVLLVEKHERETKASAFICNYDRSDEFCLYLAAGSVFRFAEPHPQSGLEHTLDARDCRSDRWFVTDEDGVKLFPD